MLATRGCGSNTDGRGFPAEIPERHQVLLSRSHLAACMGIKTKRPFGVNAGLLFKLQTGVKKKKKLSIKTESGKT